MRTWLSLWWNFVKEIISPLLTLFFKAMDFTHHKWTECHLYHLERGEIHWGWRRHNWGTWEPSDHWNGRDPGHGQTHEQQQGTSWTLKKLIERRDQSNFTHQMADTTTAGLLLSDSFHTIYWHSLGHACMWTYFCIGQDYGLPLLEGRDFWPSCFLLAAENVCVAWVDIWGWGWVQLFGMSWQGFLAEVEQIR